MEITRIKTKVDKCQFITVSKFVTICSMLTTQLLQAVGAAYGFKLAKKEAKNSTPFFRHGLSSEHPEG